MEFFGRRVPAAAVESQNLRLISSSPGLATLKSRLAPRASSRARLPAKVQEQKEAARPPSSLVAPATAPAAPLSATLFRKEVFLKTSVDSAYTAPRTRLQQQKQRETARNKPRNRGYRCGHGSP